MISIETVERPPGFPVVLSIDPSITVLGWALFDGAHASHIYDLRAWTYGRIRPKGITIQAKWEDAAARLDEATGDLSPDTLVCEWPAHFTNMKGAVAAHLGSNFPLCGLTGYLMGRFDFSGSQVTLYEPAKWKGSVPKRVTLAKFKRLFSRDASLATYNEIERMSAALSDHEIDAIMICEFWLSRKYAPPPQPRKRTKIGNTRDAGRPDRRASYHQFPEREREREGPSLAIGERAALGKAELPVSPSLVSNSV